MAVFSWILIIGLFVWFFGLLAIFVVAGIASVFGDGSISSKSNVKRLGSSVVSLEESLVVMEVGSLWSVWVYDRYGDDDVALYDCVVVSDDKFKDYDYWVNVFDKVKNGGSGVNYRVLPLSKYSDFFSIIIGLGSGDVCDGVFVKSVEKVLVENGLLRNVGAVKSRSVSGDKVVGGSGGRTVGEVVGVWDELVEIHAGVVVNDYYETLLSMPDLLDVSKEPTRVFYELFGEFGGVVDGLRLLPGSSVVDGSVGDGVDGVVKAWGVAVESAKLNKPVVSDGLRRRLDKLVNGLFSTSGSERVLVGEKLVGLIVDNFGLSVVSVEKGLNDFVSSNNELSFKKLRMIE